MDKQLKCSRLYKSYGTRIKTPVLKDISLAFSEGEFASVIGQSGSGKSTLLNCIGLLDRPDSGSVFFEGIDLYSKNDDDLAHFRSMIFGFVFQFHHLLPEFTTLENVLIPYRLAYRHTTPSAISRAKELLDRVGLTDRMNYRSTDLSGGQQQRVAIARALMNKPRLLLADEPTGNLDADSGTALFKLLREINSELKTTFLIVTHDRFIAAACDRVISINDGMIGEDLKITPNSRDDLDQLSSCYCRLRRQD